MTPEKYAFYSKSTGLVRRFVSGVPDDVERIRFLGDEDAKIIVDVMLPPGAYRIVDGQAVIV